MQKRKVAVSAVVMAGVALAGACTDDRPTEPHVLDSGTPVLFGGPTNPADFTGTLDHAFVRIAEEIPGFGGAYYDDSGTLNVVMAGARPMATAELQNRLAPHLEAMGRDAAAVQGVVIRGGVYNFVELNSMHRRAMNVLSIRGTVFTDADEVRNRVVIGVENASAAAAVERAVGMLGLPAEAIVIEQARPIQLEQTLRDRVRPVVGGLQINFPGFLCTHGFNVRSPNAPNVHGFVTNSHCSAVRSVVTGTPYAQPSGVALCPGGDNCIGNEEWDIPPTTGGACPPGRVCRWSDALGARYAPGVDNALGRIARTLFHGPTGLTPGSLEIDPANPSWEIVGELPFPMVGDSLHKTGRTNGWTTGPVNTTCQTVNVGGSTFTLFCQDRIFTWSGGGDSGSPYFERIGQTNNVRLIGIHWGSDGAGNTVMSAMNNIRCENEGPAPWITFPGQDPPGTPMCAR